MSNRHLDYNTQCSALIIYGRVINKPTRMVTSLLYTIFVKKPLTVKL